MERVDGSTRDMTHEHLGRPVWYFWHWLWTLAMKCLLRPKLSLNFLPALYFFLGHVLYLCCFPCFVRTSAHLASADVLSGQVHHPEALHQHHLITWEQYLATVHHSNWREPPNNPSCPGININQSYLLVLGFRKKGPFFRRVNCIMIDWWILVVCEIHL